MELFLTINAIKLARARDLVLVLPFIPYFRQDRKEDTERVPISARVVADMLTMSGIVKDIVTMDLHVEQEQAFFSCPTQNLSGQVILAQYFRDRFGGDFSKVVVSSTDLGGGKRAQRLAQKLGSNVKVDTLLKSRNDDASVKTLGFIGPDLTDMTVLLSDDMVDTGGSTIAGIDALLQRGAKEVIPCFSHPIFSPKGGKTAEQKFRAAGAHVVALDTIPRSKEYYAENSDWLTVLSTADYLAKVVCESHRSGGSVSALF